MRIISKKYYSIFFLAIVLFLMFIFGADVYNRKRLSENNSPNMLQQSGSTEIKDIENDLNKTDIDNLDKELQDIDSELNETR